jgi:hypothetical protein
MTKAVIQRAEGRLLTAVGATATATAMLLAVVPSASANDTSCHGNTRLDKTRVADHAVNYRFSCNADVAGYSIVSADEVAAFGTEGVVLNPATGQALNDESYQCEGVLPGPGEVCNGKAGAGHIVTSSIDTSAVPCSAKSNFYLTVTDAKGTPAGVFSLGRPRGCPSQHKKRARSRTRHRTRH